MNHLNPDSPSMNYLIFSFLPITQEFLFFYKYTCHLTTSKEFEHA